MAHPHFYHFVRRHLCDVMSLKRNPSAYLGDQARYGAQGRCLTCAVGADQCDDLTLLHVEADVCKRCDISVID